MGLSPNCAIFSTSSVDMYHVCQSLDILRDPQLVSVDYFRIKYDKHLLESTQDIS